jgi:signal transduction histidine kinase
VTPARGLAGLTLAAAAGGLVLGLVYAPADGVLMFVFMLASGAPVIVAVHALVSRRPGGSLARQFAVALAVTVALITVGVVVVAQLMFISGHDALVMTLLVLLAGGLTAYSTLLLSRDVIAERDAGEAARRSLVAAVSHDLRTPLTSLRLLADAVEDDMVDARTRRRYLEQMSLHIDSLSVLIEDLFELSRLEAGDIEWSMQKVRLDELVEETVVAMRAQAEAGQVAVRASVPDGLAAPRANPEKLQRVLFNLIQNAIRHTAADGSVTVLAASSGAGVEIEVADSGDGVLPGGPRARLRAVLPWRQRSRALARRGHRARPHYLPRHRRGPRRRDLVRGLHPGSPRESTPAQLSAAQEAWLSSGAAAARRAGAAPS